MKIHDYIRIYHFQKIAKNGLPKRENINFDIHLTDHCNLNCKGCLHFSPLAPETFLDLNAFERDLARLAELTNGRVGGYIGIIE